MTGSNVLRESFELQNSSGGLIHGDVRCRSDAAPGPVVIICHSFMAFKEWGFFPYVAERIADAGFVAVTFDFSHNGVVKHGNRITDFSSFESNTFSREIQDVGSVVKGIVGGTLISRVSQNDRIVLLGHSRGGGIAILRTAMDEHVKALVTWSAISTVDRWTRHQKERWRSLGHLPLARDSTISPLRLGIGLLNDLENHEEELSITRAAGRVQVPWLILHGKADVTVPSKEAEILYSSASQSKAEMILLDKVGHLYNAASPDDDHYETISHIIELTTHWLHNIFKEEKK